MSDEFLILYVCDAVECELVRRVLATAQPPIVVCESSTLDEAAAFLREGRVDAVLVHLAAPAELDALRTLQVAAPVVLVVPSGSEELAAQAVRAGLADVLIADQAGRWMTLLPPVLAACAARGKQIEAFEIDRMYLENLMDQTADSIYFKDRECRMLRVNRKMAQDLGYDDPQQLIGQTDVELFGAEFGARTRQDDRQVIETGKPLRGLVESRQMQDGRVNWTSTSKGPLRTANGEICGLMGITREINDLKKVQLDLEYVASHDAVTGLLNRYILTDRLEQLVAHAGRYHESFALLFIDLDNFKKINDTFGHTVGDHLLRVIGQRLIACVRKSDTVARFAGDEFIMLIESICTVQEAQTVAAKVLREISETVNLQGEQVQMTASIGVSVYPLHGLRGDDLMRTGDSAMYCAKHSGKNNFCIFDPTSKEQ